MWLFNEYVWEIGLVFVVAKITLNNDSPVYEKLWSSVSWEVFPLDQ